MPEICDPIAVSRAAESSGDLVAIRYERRNKTLKPIWEFTAMGADQEQAVR